MGHTNIFLIIGKIILSGVIAFFILTGFCYFYYNIPVHYENPDGSTDYKWEANVFYSRGTEGFAWGKTNNDGFTNMFDYDENNEIDILVMGSSHMEAYQVPMNESTASRLNALLAEDRVYNIGVSGHSFLICVDNLDAALEAYHPSKYVIIETGSISFSEEALSRALDGTTAEIPSHTGGIIGFLQKNQYLRLMYKQIEHFLGAKENDDNDTEESTQTTVKNVENVNNEQLLNAVLQKMSVSANNNGLRIIIVYHPGTEVESDGTLRMTGTESTIIQFQKLCEANGIIFMDMSARFATEYKENYVLPYGFSNSPVGSGHLNRYGHAMIADELYRLISEVA